MKTIRNKFIAFIDMSTEAKTTQRMESENMRIGSHKSLKHLECGWLAEVGLGK
jgi:hypothetical protein